MVKDVGNEERKRVAQVSLAGAPTAGRVAVAETLYSPPTRARCECVTLNAVSLDDIPRLSKHQEIMHATPVVICWYLPPPPLSLPIGFMIIISLPSLYKRPPNVLAHSPPISAPVATYLGSVLAGGCQDHCLTLDATHGCGLEVAEQQHPPPHKVIGGGNEADQAAHDLGAQGCGPKGAEVD